MKKIVLSGFFVAALVGFVSLDVPDPAIHFALSKSAPAADSTVSDPSEVRLWFTESPEEGTASIRLLNSDGDPVHTSEIVPDAEDSSILSVALHGSLDAGEYTVAWRAMGGDGHIVRGTFAFSVGAQ